MLETNLGPNILTPDTLFRVLYELKNRGMSICLTHGAFDLFHYTHLDMLHKSSKVADVLVVGIEADERVRSYKPTRPIIEEESRMSIVSQLNFVNFVFRKDIDFTSSEHVRLYKEFGIDYYTIGDDYFPEAERRLRSDCKQADAELVKLDVIKRYTTSRIIKRVTDHVKE